MRDQERDAQAAHRQSDPARLRNRCGHAQFDRHSEQGPAVFSRADRSGVWRLGHAAGGERFGRYRRGIRTGLCRSLGSRRGRDRGQHLLPEPGGRRDGIRHVGAGHCGGDRRHACAHGAAAVGEAHAEHRRHRRDRARRGGRRRRGRGRRQHHSRHGDRRQHAHAQAGQRDGRAVRARRSSRSSCAWSTNAPAQ